MSFATADCFNDTSAKPCRMNFRIPMFLTILLREGLGWTSGSRARLALRVYSMGARRIASRSFAPLPAPVNFLPDAMALA